MEAVKAGAGREDAHAAIKEHAVATVRDLREGRIASNDLPGRLAADDRVGLSVEAIDLLLSEGETRVGAAVRQVDVFLERAKSWGERYPDAVEYKPSSIL